MSAREDDPMDTDGSSSDGSESLLEDTEREILGLTSDAEAYEDVDEDEDMDLDDSAEEYASDSSSYSDDSGSKALPPARAPALPVRLMWHEGDPILSTIGLEKLNDKGCVNLETICTDQSFGYSSNRPLHAARWRAELEVQKGLYHQVNKHKKGKYGKLDDIHRIHPIFRQDNWDADDLLLGGEQNCTFDKLKPVLQLATLLLEDESTVGYIFAMLDVSSHKEITLPGVEKRLGRKVYWFERRLNLTEAERQSVWKDLYELSENLWWVEVDLTNEKEKVHGYTIGCRGSIEIHLNKQDTDCACREVQCAEDAVEWQPGSNESSARLRVMFNLATTLVHEVLHALWRNFEPYYMDTRAAELGFQWEQLLYSGQIDNPTSDRGSPYILEINNWPPPNSDDDEYEKFLMSHKKWGSSDVHQDFAVEMSFVQGVFTHEFWEEVDRYGISNFRPARMLGVRTTVASKYRDAESPTIRGLADGKPPSPDDADPKGVIDRH